MKLHFILTSKEYDLKYQYYLSVMTAIKTQNDVDEKMDTTIWCFEIPDGKLSRILKDLGVNFQKMEEVNYRALENKDSHFRAAHLKDLMTWKVLSEHGGMVLDLDTISCKYAGDLLEGKEMVVPIDVPKIENTEYPYNSAIVMSVIGSPFAKKVYDECKKVLEKPDIKWGETGPILISRMINENPDKVATPEFRVLGGFGGNESKLEYTDIVAPINMRILHLFAYANKYLFEAITPDFVDTSSSFVARLIRGIMRRDEYLAAWDVKSWLRARGGHYKPLYDWLANHEAKRILEVGTNDGKNAIGMIKTSLANEDDVEYYGFDLFEPSTAEQIKDELTWGYHNPPTKEVVETKIAEKTRASVFLFKGNSRNILPLATEKIPKMDLIYIDGGHSLETIKSDWQQAQKLMHDDTVVFFDDYFVDRADMGCFSLSKEIDPLEYDIEIVGDIDDYSSEEWGSMKTRLMRVSKRNYRTTIVDGANGYNLEVFENERTTSELKKTKQWESDTTQFIKDNLKPNQIFIDIGAHVGYFTTLAAGIVGERGKVWAFEPCERTCQKLVRNVVANNFKNVMMCRLAVTDRDGIAKLYDFGSHEPIKSLVPAMVEKHYSVNRTGVVEEVWTTTLQKETTGYPIPDIIKIDTDGSEAIIIDSITPWLKEKNITIIIKSLDNSAIEKLLALGYEIVGRGNDNYFMRKPEKNPKTGKRKFRFHLLGLAHVPTHPDIVACAYTQKVVKLARMLKSLGHEVIFYGTEGSSVECDEFVQVSDAKTREETYGNYNWKIQQFKHDPKDLAHRTFNQNAITEINKRKQQKDFLLISIGNYQQPIADAVKIELTVETGIGYTGTFAKYKVFESYAWMHHVYGLQKIENGNFYDCVIPNYFDPSDFEYSDKKKDYFLYIGRKIHRKGIIVAKETCDRIGAKLLVAGQAEGEDVDLKSPNIELVGYADKEKRKELMRDAKAVFVPTMYIGPFEGVHIEAAFSGTPVITTDHGVFSETTLHGISGYRCRTLEQFEWAAKNIDLIKPKDCRAWAEKNYSLDRIALMYQEYFEQLQGLFGRGWYAENPDRANLDWLKKYYP